METHLYPAMYLGSCFLHQQVILGRRGKDGKEHTYEAISVRAVTLLSLIVRCGTGKLFISTYSRSGVMHRSMTVRRRSLTQYLELANCPLICIIFS